MKPKLNVDKVNPNVGMIAPINCVSMLSEDITNTITKYVKKAILNFRVLLVSHALSS